MSAPRGKVDRLGGGVPDQKEDSHGGQENVVTPIKSQESRVGVGENNRALRQGGRTSTVTGGKSQTERRGGRPTRVRIMFHQKKKLD